MFDSLNLFWLFLLSFITKIPKFLYGELLFPKYSVNFSWIHLCFTGEKTPDILGPRLQTLLYCLESGWSSAQPDSEYWAKSQSVSRPELRVSASVCWGPATFPSGAWGVAHQLLSAKCTHIWIFQCNLMFQLQPQRSRASICEHSSPGVKSQAR